MLPKSTTTMSAYALVTEQSLTTIIPITPKHNYNEMYKVKVTKKVAIGPNRDEKRSADIILANFSDNELILRVVAEFFDVCTQARLSLHTGAERFAKFRECLGDTVRDDWDSVLSESNIPATGTPLQFQQAVDTFVLRHTGSTLLSDQITFLHTVTKPHRMAVTTFANRLQFINRLLTWSHGANHAPPLTQVQLKRFFLTAMPSPWKLSFIKNDNDIESPTYTMAQLIRYMTIQESAEKQEERLRNRMRLPSGRIAYGRGNNQFRPGARGYRRAPSSSQYSYQPYARSSPSSSQYSSGRSSYTPSGGRSNGGRGFYRGGPGRGYGGPGRGYGGSGRGYGGSYGSGRSFNGSGFGRGSGGYNGYQQRTDQQGRGFSPRNGTSNGHQPRSEHYMVQQHSRQQQQSSQDYYYEEQGVEDYAAGTPSEYNDMQYQDEGGQYQDSQYNDEMYYQDPQGPQDYANDGYCPTFSGGAAGAPTESQDEDVHFMDHLNF